MRRRHALQTLGTLGALTMIGGRAGAFAAEDATETSTPWIRKTLKIGMINVKGSLEEKFRVAKEAGFAGVEVAVPGVNVNDVNAAAKAAGVVIDGSVGNTHWQIRHSDPDASVRAKALEHLKQSIEETAAVGGDSCLLVVGHGKDGTQEEVRKRSSENVHAAIETAEKCNVNILIENVWNHFLYDHGGDSNQSVKPLADYVDSFKSERVGLQFDLGNHWKYGDVAAWVRELGPRIMKLDIKGFSRAENKFTKIGEGDVDWAGVEKALRDIGFKGWCAAEVGGGDASRLKEIADNMEAALHCNQNDA
ncbi:sugar phosphate isomerase/epimerase family protein [Roseiconus lacunae]|uniref:sugar phosphate isomerase/epimerase family protein n=1 Tax=Roseiconus lacunae TaxID=2605694 RepID=UPI0011F2E4D5|nr:sugar phosphate isomerase/epimerase family protein [Roseiconus lacunae]MCD0460287.1 sugar phosphate isomerase/epimerase [Roseiconus lacunae]WRQ51888.1 sugar phosphate isomerase/epimerase family protein [Stieleria sp. HD01]